MCHWLTILVNLFPINGFTSILAVRETFGDLGHIGTLAPGSMSRACHTPVASVAIGVWDMMSQTRQDVTVGNAVSGVPWALKTPCGAASGG